MGKLKKVIVLLSAMALSIAFSTTLFAAESANIKLNVNGKAASFTKDNEPVIIGGSTMLQVRVMYDLLNEDGSYTLEWYDDEKMAEFKNETTTVKIWVGDSEAEVNGKKVTINGTAPTIINNRIYVPFRFLADSFGMTVSWNEQNRTVGAMDAETIDFIQGLLSGSDTELAENAKLYADFKMDVAMDMKSGTESQKVSLLMDGLMEMDIAGKYQHMKFNMTLDMGALGKTTMLAELYDDGVNSYTSVDGGAFVKGDSTMTQIDASLIEQMSKQYNFEAFSELEKASYAAMLIKTDAAGNYVIEGNIVMPSDEELQALLKEIYGSMDMDDMMDGFKISFPEPAYVKYVVKKDTGDMVSLDMNFTMNMTMDSMGETLDASIKFKMQIPKIDMDANFESVVPDSVKSGK